MPLRLVSRSFWKNSANDRPRLSFDHVREQLPLKRLAIDASHQRVSGHRCAD